MNATQRSGIAFDRKRQAERELAESIERNRQRPTLRHRIEEQLARDALADATRHYALCDQAAVAEYQAHAEDAAAHRHFDRLCYDGGSRGLWRRRARHARKDC